MNEWYRLHGFVSKAFKDQPMIGSDIGSGRCLAISVKHRIGKIWLSLPIRVPMFGLMKNSALICFNYTQMPWVKTMWVKKVWVKTIVYVCVENEQFYAGASACGQRCAVPQRNKSAPRTRSELRKKYGKCVLSRNYCTLCEARPCVRPVRTCSHMRTSFIDFRDGRFTEGLINWLRVAAKDFRKEISSLHASGQQQIPSASI